MKNAHLRMAAAVLHIETMNTKTRVRAFSNLFAQDKSESTTHVLSLFGGDSEIAAFSGALSMGESIEITLPDGATYSASMGDKAVTYRGHLKVPGSDRPVRHLLALSQEVVQNGLLGSVYLLQKDPKLVWAAVASLVGIPATPAWAEKAVAWLEREGKIEAMDGFGCAPIKVTVNREELLEWIGEGVWKGSLPFPEQNGPVLWPAYGLNSLLPTNAAA